MARARVFLGVGSSQNPEENVRALLSLLQAEPQVRLERISTFFRTPPLPGPGAREDDPDFLNGVLEVTTSHSREEVEDLLRGIEARLGRRRTGAPFASRTMDVDILLFLPPDGPPVDVHPDVMNRAFVALPLLELAPELPLPPDGRPLAELAARFSHPGGAPEAGFTRSLRERFLPPSRREPSA